MISKVHIFIILVAVVVISGCTQNQPLPSSSPIQSSTPSPSLSVSPSQQPTEIITATPTLQMTQDAQSPTPIPQSTPLTRPGSYKIVNNANADANITDVKLALNGKSVTCSLQEMNLDRNSTKSIEIFVTGKGNFVLENVLNEYYVTANNVATIGGGVITAATDVELSSVKIGSSDCVLPEGEFKVSKSGTNIFDVKGSVKLGVVQLPSLTPTPTPSSTPTPTPTPIPIQRAFEFAIQLNNDPVGNFCPGNTYKLTVDATTGELGLPGTFKISQGLISTQVEVTDQSSCSVANKTCSATLQASANLATGQTALLSFVDVYGTGKANVDVIAC